MIFKKELTGLRLKKDLNLHKAHFRWHNQNNTGGNFGINLFRDPRSEGRKNFELTGDYDTEGRITRLKFGIMFQSCVKISNLYRLTYSDLIADIKQRIDSILALDLLT